MNGLVHVYCGDGKGKTTAAVGLGVRACGSGKRVLMAQFLKSGASGELAALQRLEDFSVLPLPEKIKFTVQMTPEERTQAAQLCAGLFRRAEQAARVGECDLLILDEVFGAVSSGLLPEEELTRLIRTRPPALELVLTGRGPSERVIRLADYVSEIRKIKHPFDRNIPARRGIEF